MKLLLAFSLVSICGLASAQDASLNTPVVRGSETKLAIKEINIRQTQVVVSLNVQTAAYEDVRYYNVVIPDPAPATATSTVVGFVTAIGTARSGETGGALRRFQFRALGYLVDTGYLPDVTLVP
jgi:hypothetical protein